MQKIRKISLLGIKCGWNIVHHCTENCEKIHYINTNKKTLKMTNSTTNFRIFLCHTGLMTACEQAVSKAVWHIPLLCVQWKNSNGGRRNCPKHVELYSKNKFEKLIHLVDFIIRIYHDARSPERQINFHTFMRIPKYISLVLLKRIVLKSCKIMDFVISKPVDRQKKIATS